MKQNKTVKILGTVVLSFFFIVILLTFLSLFGIPKAFRIFVVETGSMEPSIPTGSLAFVSPQDSYQKGDVITFNTPIEADENKNYVVTHRVNEVKSEKGETLFQTKGDANNAPDSLWTNQIKVIGKVIGSIPLLGYLIGFAKTQMGFLLVVIIPSIIIVYTELQNIAKEFKRKEYLKRVQRQNLDYI